VNRGIARIAVLALASLATLSPAKAQGNPEKAAAPAPWIKLAGSDRNCHDIQVTIGGHFCIDWTDSSRTFTLDKNGGGAQTIQTTSHHPNQADRQNLDARGGRIPAVEVRALRSYLASIDIAHLQGNCNPFSVSFDRFVSPVGYQLTWTGPAGASNTLKLGTDYFGTACSKTLLRLLNRINRISASLPTKPDR